MVTESRPGLRRQARGDVTGLLSKWRNGDEEAVHLLMPLVYQELRRLAARHLQRERADHTLDTVCLVHEAYMRLVDQRRVRWGGRKHFFAIASTVMRRILVDHARHKTYAKRGGGARPVPLDEASHATHQAPDQDVLAVHDALTRLARVNRDASRLVEMRFFGGLTNEEISEVMGISIPTVTRRWRLARAWLYDYFSSEDTVASHRLGVKTVIPSRKQ